MLLDPIYWLVIGIGALLSFGASLMVKSRYARARQVPTARGLAGAEIAQMICDSEGLDDIRIVESQGFLSDHYNPMNKTLNLSPEVFHGRDAAAAGIAAHEVGHAIQHARGYIPLQIRSVLVPAAQFGSALGPMLIFASLFLGGASAVGGMGPMLAYAGVALFAAGTVFSVVTLPVEFDASSRAKAILVNLGFVQAGDENDAVKSVLWAAALTYVAAAISAVLQLLYWAAQAGLLGGRDE
jgi:Zn-dependent membrane protease YugP